MSDAPQRPDALRTADPLRSHMERYLLSGDEAAMDHIVAGTRAKLLVVARRIGAPQDAEDAVQGAYLSLLRKRGEGLDAPVLPWLLTTVIRLSYRRKAVQKRQRDLARRLAQPREGKAPPPRSPETLAEVSESSAVVRASVARLPCAYRDAVVLRHLEGLPTRDVATLLDISEGTVRTRLHRAATLLRAKVAPALMALLLFLPWCAADAWQQLVRHVRPILTQPVTAVASVGVLLIAAVGLSVGLLGNADRSATPRTSSLDAPPVAAHGSTAPPSKDAASATTAGTGPCSEERPASALPEALRESQPAEAERRRIPPPPGTDAPDVPRYREDWPVLAPSDENIAVGPGSVAPPPGGMVLLEGGHVQIGTKPAELDRLLAGRPALVRKLFRFEVPRHTHSLRPYYIGRCEVTNAQYLVFLQGHTVTYCVGQNSLESLDAIAAHLVGLSESARAHPKQLVWRQLYEANKGAIWRAFGKRAERLLVWRRDHTIDEEATARQLRHEPLPAKLTLSFYTILPPQNWPGMQPPTGERDHPVRYVSYNDAEACAEWMGLHVPTEAEWEWAARGPEGRRFPWGAEWYTDTSHANWGGKITNEAFEPRTVAVAEQLSAEHDARSWCGAHHMTGNVTEWTSSWFEAYPGNAERSSKMGRWVKVLRGGSAADAEKIVLRPACRNWVGGGADAPPYPESRFQWAGFRLAGYRVPGLDQVEPILRRAVRARMIARSAFDPERFTAIVTRNWLSEKAAVQDHVFVLGATRAIVFVPVRSLLRDAGFTAMRKAWKRHARFRKRPHLMRESESDPWVLGALHTDLALALEPDPIPGGTYLLCLWKRRIALMTSNLEFIAFLPTTASGKPSVSEPSVEVRSHSSKQVGSPTQRLTIQADEGVLDFRLPLGGKTRDKRWYVTVRTFLPFEAGALATPHGWLRSDAGR